MNSSHLVYPMFAMFGLTCVILVMTFRARVAAVKAGEIEASFYRTFQNGVEPEKCAKLSRQFKNLFEAPVLFYAICLVAMISGQAGWLVIGLAWAYVLLRMVHSYIHVGANRLRGRIRAYFSSWLVLAVLWVVVVLGISGIA